ncbi:MEDS: MEthanogen/methylotroph, DcmR Sensory domain [Geodermatophilus telluris]|uniref:MEDS: MEthanogen/methylotroph, DcmR Sensory domain n=1 Tax=Geodermatophilus telluris TaxID=1190417 RepID=A0A1G6VDB2_9ACTN|nr:MEDS domain-containing protein [Geodermatophilus telluris]SDD51612.1 MEDS: MEthanogen/methylotroph, DcmR Sensory domain [Geodermatophilus telluris]
MSRGRHDWVVLDSEEAHAEVVGDFVVEGVRRGECVLLTGLGTREPRLWARLRRAGVVGQAWEPGATTAVRVVPPDPARLPGYVTGALAEGFPGVRFTGALGPGDNPFEQVVTELAAEVPLTVLCPYFRHLLAPEQVPVLAAAHDSEVDAAGLYDDGTFRLTRTPGGLRLAGELDSGNADALRAVLQATPGGDGGPATWDVADLRFLDVGAADSLVAAAAGPPGLVLVGASRLTSRLVRLLATRHPGRTVQLAQADGSGSAP